LWELPPEAKKLAEIAYRNSNQLVNLINDLLELEKFESGKMKIELKPVDLNVLLKQAIEVNSFQAEQSGVKFSLENNLSEAKIIADPFRLMQVLNNLFGNAIKFSPEKDMVIITVERYQKNIRVAVVDHGPGIPKEFQKKIFEKFAQGESSKKRGSGLGLHISKNIIEKMGGQIGFETNSAGTTFYFDLPELREEK
jgi:signal transduction histidine kinase